MRYLHSYWVLGLLLNFIIVKAQKCMTPRQQEGVCITLLKCDSLFHLIQLKSISENNIQLLRHSHCGFDGVDPKVCCPLEPTENKRSRSGGNLHNLDTSLLPNIRTCGGNFVDKILMGKNVDLGELPWMSLIEYETPNGSRHSCGGVLISKRYVLTAAHCVKGQDLPSNWKISRVRLGEYDTTKNPDCYTIKNEITCALPAVDIPVEKQILHEMYDPYDDNRKHDIALLRLEREVNYTAYVQPICLPLSNKLREKNFENENLLVAGWGKTENDTYSTKLLKLSVPVQSDSSCAQLYEGVDVQLGKGQMCAGGRKNEDSCTGDSGGPLMARHIDGYQVKWVLAGLISLGPDPCGLKGFPGIYTRVSHYIPWIIGHLEP